MPERSSEQPEGPGAGSIEIVYDGECPFCAAYIRVLRLRELAGTVELIDAREDHPLVAELIDAGIDLDEGMVVKIGETISYGDEAVQKMALMTGRSRLFNRLNYLIFRDRRRSRLIYPFLKIGRKVFFKMVGKPMIVDERNPSSP